MTDSLQSHLSLNDESSEENDSVTFNPLVSIQTDLWTNIPSCVIEAVKVIVNEIKGFDIKVKYVIDKLGETQIKLDTNVKRIERSVNDCEQRIVKLVSQQRDDLNNSIKILNYDNVQIHDKLRQNTSTILQLEEKLDIVLHDLHLCTLKKEHNDDMKSIKNMFSTQIDLVNKSSKEYTDHSVLEALEIPNLCGRGKRYLDSRLLLKDLYQNFESKTKILDEISNKKSEYFSELIASTLNGLNLPRLVRKEIESELKSSIMNESLLRIDDKMKQFNINVQQYISKFVMDKLNTLTDNNSLKFMNFEQKLSIFKDSNYNDLEKINENIYLLENKIQNVTNETKNKTNSVQKIQEFQQKIEHQLEHTKADSQNRISSLSASRSAAEEV